MSNFYAFGTGETPAIPTYRVICTVCQKVIEVEGEPPMCCEKPPLSSQDLFKALTKFPADTSNVPPPVLEIRKALLGFLKELNFATEGEYEI